ncbi:MAG: hypothetical protein NT031_02035 [Planctomycetota bacterium]|nr:hypothetical protein [Planctomycetota bacterium]
MDTMGLAVCGGGLLLCVLVSGCAEPEDIHVTPGVRAAQGRATSVQPGEMLRIPFSAYDIAHLVGLEGASFIVRLPDSALENNLPDSTLRVYEKGQPVNPLAYAAPYPPGFREKTRCWLVDVGALVNHFAAKNVSPGSLLTVRFKSLEDDGLSVRRFHIDETSLPAGSSEVCYAFTQAPIRNEAQVGLDIPIACWFQSSPEVSFADGVLGVAKTSPKAFVIFIRFGHDASAPKSRKE